jgi:hypothetical protein
MSGGGDVGVWGMWGREGVRDVWRWRCGDVGRICLAEDMVSRQILVNTILKLGDC